MINLSIRIVTVLTVVMLTGTATAQVQNHIKSNPFFVAKQEQARRDLAIKNRDSERANKALKALRQHIEANDLFDEKLDLEHDVEAMKSVVSKIQQFYWLANRISKDGVEHWVSRVDTANGVYLNSGKFESEALPFINGAATRYKSLYRNVAVVTKRDKQGYKKSNNNNRSYAGSHRFRSSTSYSQTYVHGYYRSDGTYVRGHYRTKKNHSQYDNWSTKGNINPHTHKHGYVDPSRR